VRNVTARTSEIYRASEALFSAGLREFNSSVLIKHNSLYPAQIVENNNIENISLYIRRN